MPALGIVAVAEHAADARLDLDPGNQAGDDPPAVEPPPLGQRQNDRRDRCGRVARHGAQHIVEIERVSGSAVDQRRLAHRGLGPAAEQGCARGAALLGRLGPQHERKRLLRSGERDAQPVQQALAGHETRLGRQVLIADAGGKAREFVRHMRGFGLAAGGLAHSSGPPGVLSSQRAARRCAALYPASACMPTANSSNLRSISSRCKRKRASASPLRLLPLGSLSRTGLT